MSSPLPDTAARSPEVPEARQPFSVMAKPIGPVCNLDCSYCYYVSKRSLYDGDDRRSAMGDTTLETYIRTSFAANPASTVTFAWQGGEPTLLGLGYFRRIIAMQRRHCPPGKSFANALQTNGTLLDDGWCAFLRDERFLVGLSIDGPEDIHDSYRRDRGQQPTWSRVMEGAARLRRHQVEFNTLSTVNRQNQDHGRRIYDFLVREVKSRHLQFVPIVERRLEDGSDPGAPDLARSQSIRVQLSRETVRADGFGRFLCDIYDHWRTRDIGRVHVYAFEQVLSQMIRCFSGICLHEETCGRAMALERDGHLYACDHYVYPEYRLGHIADQSLAELADSPRQRQFGLAKRDRLPQ